MAEIAQTGEPAEDQTTEKPKVKKLPGQDEVEGLDLEVKKHFRRRFGNKGAPRAGKPRNAPVHRRAAAFLRKLAQVEDDLAVMIEAEGPKPLAVGVAVVTQHYSQSPLNEVLIRSATHVLQGLEVELLGHKVERSEEATRKRAERLVNHLRELTRKEHEKSMTQQARACDIPCHERVNPRQAGEADEG